MKKLAFLEYTFVFEPDANTWGSGSEFETDLTNFFAVHGLYATNVQTAGGNARRLIYIQSMDKLDKLRNGGATEPKQTDQKRKDK